MTEIPWADHQPGLLDPERKTVDWRDVPAERIPEVMETHQPVCWNCHVMNTFTRSHPELIVDRSR